jgi:hypothetical protein
MGESFANPHAEIGVLCKKRETSHAGALSSSEASTQRRSSSFRARDENCVSAGVLTYKERRLVERV